MRKIIVLGLMALAMAGGSAGKAAAGSEQREQTLEHLDRNGDGFISRAEADAFRGGRFDAMDEDGDGAVSRGEMLQRLQRRMEQEFGQRFDSFDADRNGRIDRQEYQRRERGRFDKLDRNGDGRISPKEMKRARGRN